MSELKLCKNCKHSPTGVNSDRAGSMYYQFAQCHHEQGCATNLVDGKTYKHLCSSMRYDEDFCGSEGVYFEARDAAKK